MTDQTNTGTSGGTPAGTPGGELGNTGGSFLRTRTAQLERTMAQPAPGEPAADAGQQPQPQLQTPHSPPAEQKIRIGDAEYDPADAQARIARDIEAEVRRSALPQSPDGYQVTLPSNWQMPVGVPPGTKFEFDMNSPELAGARSVAHAEGMSQEGFSKLLGYFAASKIGEQRAQLAARDANLAQLGSSAFQRIDAIGTWLGARAGKDGAAVGNFIRQYPSAPIVRAMESLIKQFSSQGGADFSQSHRDQAEEQGKIPGYDNMSFVQKRAAQMAQMLNRSGPRGGGRRE